MAKRQFVTGAVIIAAGAVASGADAVETASAWTGSVHRGTGQPVVSSTVRVDEDITALGGLRERREFMTVAAAKTETISMEPIIVNPRPPGGGGGGADTFYKPPPTPPPVGIGPGQDTLRPTVIPRVRRIPPTPQAPRGRNKP